MRDKEKKNQPEKSFLNMKEGIVTKRFIRKGSAVLLAALIMMQAFAFAVTAEDTQAEENTEAVLEEPAGEDVESYAVRDAGSEEPAADPVQEDLDEHENEIIALTPATEEELAEIFGEDQTAPEDEKPEPTSETGEADWLIPEEGTAKEAEANAPGESESWSEDQPEETDPSGTLTGEDAGNYVLTSTMSPAKGNIVKASECSIAFADRYTLDKSFDREAVSLPAEYQMELSSVNYSELQFAWYQDGQELSDAPVNPGSYSLKAWCEGNANHTAAEAEISFTISKAEIHAIVADISVTYGEDPDTFIVTYSGPVLPKVGELEGNLKYSFNYSAGDSVGTYPIQASGYTSDYFDITYVPGTLTVEPRELTVDWSGVSGRVYGDGVSVTGVLNTGNIYGSDDVSISVKTDKADGAGTHAASASLTGAAKDNYVLANGTVTYEIAPIELTLGYSYDREKIYDGTTGASVELTVSGTINGDEVTAGYESAAYNSADVGDVDSILISGITLGGKDADNYCVQESASVPASILARSLDTLEIRCESNYVYSGTQYAEIRITYNGAELAEGKDYTVKYYSGQDEVAALTNAGTYTVEITGTGNFTGTYSARVTVSKAKTSLTVIAVSKTYDGLPAQVSVSADFDVSGAVIAWYDADRNPLDSAPVHVGQYSVDVTLDGTDDYTGLKSFASCEITPAEPTVFLADKVTTFTGEPVRIGDASVILVNGETWDGTVRYTYYDQNGNELAGAPVSAGSYTVTASVDASGDYTSAESSPAALTILKADMGGVVVTAEGYSGVYDGSSHGISVTLGGNTEGVRITYSTQEDGEYTETAPAFKETGDYTVYYRISRDNYNDLTGSVNVHIGKASQALSYETASVTKAVGDPEFVNPLTETLVFGSVTYSSSDPSVAVVDENGTVTIAGAGTATITAAVSGTGSYDPAEASYVLTVTDNSSGNDSGSNGNTGGQNGNSSSENGKAGSSPQTGDIESSSFNRIIAAAVVGALGLAAALTAVCMAVKKYRIK